MKGIRTTVLRSPVTGEPLLVQGFLGRRGWVHVPPVMGGDGTGDGGTGSGEGSPSTGSTGTGSTDPATGGTGGTEPGTGASEPPEENVPLSKFRQQEEQLRAADRRRQEAENRLKAIEDKDKSELERASGKLQELEATNKQLQDKVHQLTVQNAFLSGNTYTWHDPEDALALAERKGFLDDAINKETGEVDVNKVKTGLKTFADKHQHLIKTTTPEEGDGKGKGQQPQPATPPVGSNGAGNKGGKGKSEQELRSKFSALRN